MASFNQEVVSRKPNAIFPDMPYHVKQSIVNFTNADTQLSLNLVSKECKKLVDNATTHYERLAIEFESDSISMDLDMTMWISFEQVGTTCIVHTYDRTTTDDTDEAADDPNKTISTKRKNSNAIENAAELAMKYLLNPKCSFTRLMIDDYDILGESFYEILKKRLTQMNHQIHVEEISGSPIAFKHLLPFLKPEVVREMDFCGGDFDIISLRPITRLEHWRHATEITVSCTSDLLLEDLIHASRIDLRLGIITRGDFETMMKSCRGNPTKSIRVETDEGPDVWITQYLQQFECSKKGNRVTYNLPNIKIVTWFSRFDNWLIVKGKSM